MSDLIILHRKTKENIHEIPVHNRIRAKLESVLLQSPLWKTCIRELYFIRAEDYEIISDASLLSNEEWLVGEAALQRLLEILCGLESPVVGETEVFGQFKLFIQNVGLKDHWVQFILAKVKSLRNQFLTNIGSHSYGSLLRKSSKGVGSFSVLGSGHLVEEMLPWITNASGTSSVGVANGVATNNVSIVPTEILARDTIKAQEKFPQVPVKSLYHDSANYEALVIAAPVSDQMVLDLLRSSPKTRLVYDFRGEPTQLSSLLDDRFFYKGLSQFFDDLKEIQNQTIQLVQVVKREIKILVNEYHSRLEHRPMGWDDLCA